jgi:TetR/AcrR family transcriptional repressor of nem operon
MRYTKEHKLRTRGRIVERASLALREEGADGVSVAALMDLAGLTHGGFYAHFESREALVVEAVLMAMDQTMSRWLQLIETTPVADRFNAIVDTYINAQDRDNRGRGCPLPALGADIARSSEKARRAFAQKLQEMIEVMRRQLPNLSARHARRIATAAIATMTGTIVLSRASGERELSDYILKAGRQAARLQSVARISHVVKTNAGSRGGKKNRT